MTTMEYQNCTSCGAPCQETMIHADGRCVPCKKVHDGSPEDGLPVEAVLKLCSMACSRHPEVCNKDAPTFRNLLEKEGYLAASPQSDEGSQMSTESSACIKEQFQLSSGGGA